MEFHAKFFHGAHEFLAHGAVHGGNDAVRVFHHLHFCAETGINRPQFKANHATSNDDHGFGKLGQAQGLRARDHAFFVNVQKRKGARLGPGGDDDVAGPDVRGLAFGRGHGDGVGIHKRSHAVVDIDVVLLHQEVDALCGLGHHLAFARNHLRKIDAQRPDFDAVCGELLLRLMIVLRAVEKRL